MPRLTVDLNEDGLHSIAAPSTFETGGPFEIELDNHDEAVHVHLNLDDTLSTVAHIRANNHYVEPNRSRSVTVDVEPRGTDISGRLKIATGYGSEVVYTTVTVTPPDEEPHRVDVDESLSVPATPEPEEPSLAELLADNGMLPGEAGPVIVIGLVAIALSAVAAATIESPAVLAGSLIVLVGVAVAVAISIRP
ncbi:hypothetical protein EGH24_07645 [Halonotius terrestris]|uniref:Uncharacterized protein n=1 Tax=Halonotius terrestris TaxID=2487750 RepID=A0A8J8PBL2_9EURY|nr:hypothetical protein [Halonotius terrestris]TQQ81017.1 hypothetical protein EGH24_07645 [Halonotius terrestris]